jgi:hypothetical protein
MLLVSKSEIIVAMIVNGIIILQNVTAYSFVEAYQSFCTVSIFRINEYACYLHARLTPLRYWTERQYAHLKYRQA